MRTTTQPAPAPGSLAGDTKLRLAIAAVYKAADLEAPDVVIAPNPADGALLALALRTVENPASEFKPELTPYTEVKEDRGLEQLAIGWENTSAYIHQDLLLFLNKTVRAFATQDTFRQYHHCLSVGSWTKVWHLLNQVSSDWAVVVNFTDRIKDAIERQVGAYAYQRLGEDNLPSPLSEELAFACARRHGVWAPEMQYARASRELRQLRAAAGPCWLFERHAVATPLPLRADIDPLGRAHTVWADGMEVRA